MSNITFIFSYWCCYSFYNWPTICPMACAISTTFYRIYLKPFPQRISFSCNSNLMTIISILRLFTACSPSAIFRRIRAIIVNAIESKPILIGSNYIIIKIRETIFPAFTHENATSAVISIIRKIRIITTILQIPPTQIKFCTRHTMSCFSFSYHVLFITTTTFSIAIKKVINSCNSIISTVTFALHKSASTLFASKFYNNQPTKSFIENINGFSKSFCYDWFRHCFSPIKKSYCLEPFVRPMRMFGSSYYSGQISINNRNIKLTKRK